MLPKMVLQRNEGLLELTGNRRKNLETPKVLIVDDEQNILLFLSEALEDEGYTITTKGSGKEAVSIIEHEDFDLVLVDLKLHDIDGLEVTREVKKHSPDTVVIMLTGHGSLDTAVEAMRFGVFDYLLKPCSIQDLRNSLRRGLEKRQSSLEQQRLLTQARQFARAVLESGALASGIDTGFATTSTTPVSETETAKASEIVQVGDVIVDIKKHEVKRSGEILNLTPTEFNLLLTLMNNAGRVLSCKSLVKLIHNYDLGEYDSRSMIRVHIKHLRHKIERDPNNPDYIINVRGLGYKFGA
jgi:DNA-binding response OmpR family regulator